MKVVWTQGAVDDLEELTVYIRRDKPDAATRVARSIYDRILSLQTMPFRGRRREEDDSLEFVIPGLPYIVLYEVIGEGIFIKAV